MILLMFLAIFSATPMFISPFADCSVIVSQSDNNNGTPVTPYHGNFLKPFSPGQSLRIKGFLLKKPDNEDRLVKILLYNDNSSYEVEAALEVFISSAGIVKEVTIQGNENEKIYAYYECNGTAIIENEFELRLYAQAEGRNELLVYLNECPLVGFDSGGLLDEGAIPQFVIDGDFERLEEVNY